MVEAAIITISTGQCSKLGETGVIIGPYPKSAADIQVLASHGVTGVLSLQTKEDMTKCKLEWPVL
jgi:hypothetical protein